MGGCGWKSLLVSIQKVDRFQTNHVTWTKMGIWVRKSQQPFPRIVHCQRRFPEAYALSCDANFYGWKLKIIHPQNHRSNQPSKRWRQNQPPTLWFRSSEPIASQSIIYPPLTHLPSEIPSYELRIAQGTGPSATNCKWSSVIRTATCNCQKTGEWHNDPILQLPWNRWALNGMK